MSPDSSKALFFRKKIIITGQYKHQHKIRNSEFFCFVKVNKEEKKRRCRELYSISVALKGECEKSYNKLYFPAFCADREKQLSKSTHDRRDRQVYVSVQENFESVPSLQ